ncbi:MAG: transcription elongation factor GreA [Phycisphaerales bacterium]|jgi:transcription elongation factor GreA
MEILTPEEKKRLETTLSELRVRGKELIERIAEARALGDLKENAEYHSAREDQAQNNARIKQLEDRLAVAQVADNTSLPEDMVFIGATVKLREVDTGDEDLYRIVGEATGDMSVDYVEVTVNSPLGTSLMKSRVGETVRVDLPRGEARYLIVEIVA